MEITLNTATPSKKRLSCDRCHGQKLRCIRPSLSDSNACNRCLRQGAQCVYSSSLPKGRPNTYRLSNASTATFTSSAVTPVSPRLRHRRRSNSQTTLAPTDATTNLTMSEDASLNGSIDTSETISVPAALSPWPSLDHSDWRNLQLGWSEQDWDLWNSDLHTLPNHQHSTRSILSNAIPHSLDWDSTRKSNGICDAQETSSSSTYSHRQDYSLEDELSQCNSKSTNSRKRRSEISIARLAHLSTRLYPLHRSSCTLAETARSPSQAETYRQAGHNTLISDAAFKSMATWLVHVSSNMRLPSQNERRDLASNLTSTGDTLHEVFSASHQFLETLRFLQLDAVSTTSTLTRTLSTSTQASAGGSHPDFWASITPESTSSIPSSAQNSSSLDQQQVPSDHDPSSDQYSETIVRHLIIACHTLLLNIYTAVLAALQHDADQGLARALNHDDYVEAAALADIRIVMAVQLCSYLVERQFQAVDLHLSPRLTTQTLQQPSPPLSTIAEPSVVDELKIEVQQRMVRLRQTLRL